MKIALTATFLGQKTSGAEISALHLAESLHKHEDVIVLTTKKNYNFPFKCYSLKSARKIPNLGLLIGHHLLDRRIEKEIHRIFKRQKPDLVHIQDPSLMIPTIKAARKLGIPTATTVRDYRFSCNLSIPLEKGIVPFQYSKRTYKKWLQESFEQAYGKGWISHFVFNWFYTQNNRLRNFFKKMDYYVTVSDFVKNKVIESGIDGNKVKTIKVQKEDWDPNTPSERSKHPRIFTAGGLKATKGFDFLIESFRTVVDKYPNAQLRIAGDGSAKQKLLRIRKKLNMGKNVVFLGQIDHDKMKTEYASADFIASPSLWPEPLTRIIFESFSMKKTIIATNVGGSSELVMDGKTGLLVEPRDREGMGKAMLRLIENKKLRDRMAKAGNTLINKVSAPKVVYSEHIKVYKDVIKRTANARRRI